MKIILVLGCAALENGFCVLQTWNLCLYDRVCDSLPGCGGMAVESKAYGNLITVVLKLEL